MPKSKKQTAEAPEEKRKHMPEDKDVPMDPEESPDDEEEEEQEGNDGGKKKTSAAIPVKGLPLAASVYDRLWAIKKEKLFELAHWPEKLKAGFFEEMFGESEGSSPEIVSGKAIINVFGVLDQRSSFLMLLFGGCSTEGIYKQIESLVARADVSEILLNIDSPGGAVDGIENLANLIYASREKKPIIAFVNPLACSGAIWIARACSRVYLASNTTITGSIGVVTAHRDVSKAEEMWGIKTTEITAGKYKRIDSQYKPLSKEGEEYLQGHVNHVYTVFVDSIAKFCGKTSQEVLEKMADGRIFVGAQAVECGLADKILSLEDYLKGESMGQTTTVPAPAPAQAPQASAQGVEIHVSEQYLAEKCPDLLAGIQKKAREEGFQAGAKAERERIQAIEANTMPGFENLAAQVKFDGQTTGDQFALACFKKQKENGITLSAMRADNKVVAAAPTANQAGNDPKAAQINAMSEGMEMAKNRKGGK